MSLWRPNEPDLPAAEQAAIRDLITLWCRETGYREGTLGTDPEQARLFTAWREQYQRAVELRAEVEAAERRARAAEDGAASHLDLARRMASLAAEREEFQRAAASRPAPRRDDW